MNENPTASKTFLRPSAPISLELTSFATCKDGQIDEIQAVMGFWSPTHRLLFTIYIVITSISAAIFSLSVLAFSISLMQRSKSIVTAPWCALYRKQRCSFADSAIYIKVVECSVSNLTSSTDQSEIGSQLTMDLESVFDGPLSTGSSGKKSGVSVSVWQAEVALRLSEWGISMISDEWFDERFISMVIPNLWNIRFSS